MNTEFVRILSRNVGQNRPVVNFSKAIESEAKDAFLLSGSEHIMCFLRQKLGDDVPFLIDFSAIPSSFKNDGKLADFISIYDSDSSFVDNINLDSAFASVYGYLQKNSLGMFYHPRFFDSPDEPKFYYSNNSGVFPPKNSYQLNTGKKWYEERLGTSKRLYFKNMSFQISYESYKEKSEKALQKTESLQERNDILLGRYNNFFLRFRLLNQKRSTHLLSVPIIGYPSKDNENSPFEGLGSIFVYFIKNNFDEGEIKGLANDLWFLGLQITYNSIFQIAMELAEKARKESVKSAKAAIMSRNMSHNLGSHVMFYIKQRLESVEKILQTGSLHDLVKSDSIERIKENLKNPSTQPGEEMPFLVGLGRFINYLQERQDYIATVATDYIPYKTSISFKDAIYDELKPDLRAQRHNNDKTVKGKQPANLLLDYIAYSEGFHPSKSIKLKFGYEFDGTSQNVPSDLRKLNVALPSGNLGRQAFFSIMENVIRNTAKHDGVTNENKGILGFQFDILDGSQLDNIDFIALAEDSEKEIQKDRMLKRLNCYRNIQNKENYYYIGITANTGGSLKNINGVIQKIQDGLIDLYIENDGQMRDEYKGIKEMRISAAWMRGYGIDTDIPINEPPALAVRDNGGHIQYIVCLPKPKKIAFVSSTFEQIKDERMPEGLKLFKTLSEQKENSTEDAKAVKRFVKDNGIADYEMILCTKEYSKRLTPYVGSRIYTCDETEITNLIKAVQDDGNKNEDDRVNVIGDIYIKWLEQRFKCQQGGKLPKLVINDGQAYDNHKEQADCSRERKVELGDDRIVFNSGDSASNQLVYSKHYNPKEHRFYDDAPFVEGISGGNSTDRLLRQDEWTKEWYVKHMTAALTKVAIFDERIYSNFVRPSTRKWNIEDIKDWLDKHEEILKDKNPLRALLKEMNSLSKKIKTAYIEALLEKNDNGEYEFTKSDEKLTPLLPLLPRKSCTDCTIADLYRRKGVWAFNIEVEENENGKKCVIIKGYTKENGETEIARMTKKPNEQTIVLDVDDDFKKKFHFITIHQGVLDKIYSALEIGKEEKNKITDEFFDKFSNSEKEDEYLPRFIIHSGRSKPNNADMPQKQPFIQFAALDHAVKDCKYTLTELLYSAHYE